MQGGHCLDPVRRPVACPYPLLFLPSNFPTSETDPTPWALHTVCLTLLAPPSRIPFLPILLRNPPLFFRPRPRAVEENFALRRSLQELEQLYSSTVAPASPGMAPTGAAAAAAAPGVSHGTAAVQAQQSPPPPPAASYGGLRTPSQYASPSGAGTAPAGYGMSAGGASGQQYNPYNPYGPYSAGVAAGTPQSAGGNRSTYTSQYSPSQVPYDDDYSRRASAVSAATEGGIAGSHMVSLGGPPPPGEYGSPQTSGR